MDRRTPTDHLPWQYRALHSIALFRHLILAQACREGGGVFPGPATFEKGVPDGFSLTSNMHKIHFRPGLRPGPDHTEEAYDAPQTSSSTVRVHFSPYVSSLTLSTPLASRSRRIWNEVVIGPRDNCFPGPAVALNGPVQLSQLRSPLGTTLIKTSLYNKGLALLRVF